MSGPVVKVCGPSAKTRAPKMVANDLCELITKLFDLVVEEGFSASWTINVIQTILWKTLPKEL